MSGDIPYGTDYPEAPWIDRDGQPMNGHDPYADVPPPEPPPDDDADEHHAEESEDGPTTWEPLDLGPWINGEITRPEPTLGVYRSDGQRLIYPGREHAVLGETESGKTWVALGCVAAELTAGNYVVYIHYEESDPAPPLSGYYCSASTRPRFLPGCGSSAPVGPPEPNGSHRCCTRRPPSWFTTASTRRCH